MSAAVFFDCTPYGRKAANAAHFYRYGSARDWWNSDKARRSDTGRPWWQQEPKTKDAEKPAANRSILDWFTK